MLNILLGFLITSILFMSSLPVNAMNNDQKNLENLVIKVSKKFSRTYCNTFKFGISNDGAVEFALGETNKEFAKNKMYQDIDLASVSKQIISNIESECQVYDFPENELNKLNINIK